MKLTNYLAGLLAALASAGAMSTPLLSEGFNDVAALAADGWVMRNDSAPPGSTGWFQGDPAVFAAVGGAADSYVAANFNNAAYGGAVSNWLMTPRVSLSNGETLNFSLRLLGEGLLDRVEVYFSTSGASTNLADFSFLAAFESDSDTGWLDKTVLVNTLAAPASGRYALRYVVDDTSRNGDYIGLDSLHVDAVAIPAPGTVALLCMGAVVAVLCARRQPWPRWPAGVGLATAAAVTTAAAAATTPAAAGPAAPRDDGLMSFPHVRIEARAAGVAAAGGQGGFMAYKDPVTGALTNPTAEQAAELAAASRAMRPPARQGIAGLMVTRPPYGGISVMLDDQQARYAVARKSADGKLSQSCEPRQPSFEGERK